MFSRRLVICGLMLALALPGAGAFAQTPTYTPSPTPTMTPTPTATPDYRALLPVGAVMIWAGSSTPTGWLIADGSCLDPDDYPALSAAIGETFGYREFNPPEWNHQMFCLPDLRGRVPVGAGQGSGLTARALAATFGEEAHILTTYEMPSHSHTVQTSASTSGGTNSIYAPTNRLPQGAVISSEAGGGAAHNIMQPSLTLNYIINAGTVPLEITGSSGGNVEITPEPYWVISTVEAGGTAQTVGFAYSVTAGDFMIVVLLLLLIGLVLLSLFVWIRNQKP